ncbi:hypothetical protein A2U01_0093085, partial [Trifolium medium]|nr:hypothetical protein [Trifolium medium]
SSVQRRRFQNLQLALNIDAETGQKTVEEHWSGDAKGSIGDHLKLGLICYDRTRLLEVEESDLVIFKAGRTESEFESLGE